MSPCGWLSIEDKDNTFILASASGGVLSGRVLLPTVLRRTVFWQILILIQRSILSMLCKNNYAIIIQFISMVFRTFSTIFEVIYSFFITMSFFIWPSKSECKALFVTQTIIFFWMWHTKRYCQYAFIKIIFGSLEQIVTNWWIVEKKFGKNLQNMMKFEFFAPQRLGAGANWKAFLAVQSSIPGKILVFDLGYTLLDKYWCTIYEALSSSLKCYAWSANLII